jgi:acyl carrier protein phosphodiesterase
MDELREDFTRVAAHCSKQQLDVFFKHTLGGRNWEQWTGNTLAVRAILLDELSRF